MIRTGLDIFCDNPSVSGTVGLLSNVASQNRLGQTAHRALSAAGVTIGALFAPEHGYFGLGAAGEAMTDSTLGELPIYSLYGKARTPPPDVLRGLNAMIIDLQETGNRWYTYAGTMRNVIKACAGVGVPVIVLDRPNPQGGIVVEGNVADNEFFSLVAPAAMPARHGMTIGEIARYFNHAINADLFVIAMDGWRRDMLFNDAGLRWVAPSPNMPTLDTVLLYSGTCLIEGTTLSEGRGTALPFQQIGAPYIDGERLADEMNALELQGVFFSPAWFQPQSSKYAGQACQGVRIHIDDPHRVLGFAIGIYLLNTIFRMYPAEFGWASWDGKTNAFDTLVAARFVRPMIESGQPPEDILALCDEQAGDFQSHSAAFWLYED